ncbi:beta-N-acetylhexosaminidase [Radiobacillus sp. PE A8.2]|uniref:beta-N-acetylhexosaminidase n=1 Tax=Radiobacillus sp. PE A8.2 TaxID=3380349 RepID=UPI00388F190E
MKIHFTGDMTELEKGIEILEKELHVTIASDGLHIQVEKTEENSLSASLNQNQGLIRYKESIHFFRALGLFMEAMEDKSSFEIKEEPQFTMNGGMFDCSRNAVMKVETVQLLLRKMAVMGLNTFMLYTEDTYTIEGEPYFGYMRGRYTSAELEQIDNYAAALGIEVIPCIQTLAHLATYLQWPITQPIQDTDDILLANAEETYSLIEKMIATASKPFRSNRIHIGMDEAHFLGRGKYLDKNGYQSSFQIMSAHLERVKYITEKYKLKPMIWSDMYFRLGSKNGKYYDKDLVIPEAVIEEIPDNVQFVYWDYYHNDHEFYCEWINKHREFGSDPIFAGAVWTFNGMTINYDKTFTTTNAALSACKKEGVQEVFSTFWGDNGAETNVFTALLGLQLFAEHGYSKELDTAKLKRRFKFCTQASYQGFMDLGKLDYPPCARPAESITETPGQPDNPSKFLLWQDPLMGLFDKHVEKYDLNTYYLELKVQLEEAKHNNQDWAYLFDVPIELCNVLSIKSNLGNKLKHLYETNDKVRLQSMLESELPTLRNRINLLKQTHKRLWHKTNKPFGWEVLDIRYGGLLARMETTMERLQSYVDGELEEIEELEQDRLYYHPIIEERGGIGRNNIYTNIATANVL